MAEILDVKVLPEGSVVAVRCEKGLLPDQLRKISESLLKAGRRRKLSFIVTANDINLSVLTDEELAKAGLQRIEREQTC